MEEIDEEVERKELEEEREEEEEKKKGKEEKIRGMLMKGMEVEREEDERG